VIEIKKIILMLISIAFIYGILNIQIIYAQEKTIEIYGWVEDELGNIVKDVEVPIRVTSSLEEVITFSKNGYYKCTIRIKEDEQYVFVKAEYENLEQPRYVVILDPSKNLRAFNITIKGLFIGWETVTETFSPTTTIRITVPAITLYWVGTRTYTTIIGTKTKIVEEFVSITDNKGTTITEKIIDVEEYEREHMFEHIFSILPWIVGLLIFAIISVYLAKKTSRKTVKKSTRKTATKKKEIK
jgi:hypothetical protein